MARKWGYDVKGVPDGSARIIVAAGNFHGRTTTIVGFSDDDPTPAAASARSRPASTSSRTATLAALEAAITPHTAAVLIEPIQGEGGVVIPPDGYLPRRARDVHPRAACSSSPTRSRPGSAASARTFACDHAGVVPDLYLLGKALGGGVVPVSAVVGDRDVLGVHPPGTSTARRSAATRSPAAVGLQVVEMLRDGRVPGARDRASASHLARPTGGDWSATA